MAIISQPVLAYNLESVTIKNTLTESGNLLEEMDLLIKNNTNEFLIIHLPKKAYSIKINNKESNTKNTSVKIETKCVECEVKLSYQLDNVVKETKTQTYDFSRTINLPKKPTELLYSVKIPPGEIINLNEENNIIPKEAYITTDGEGIIINWKETEPNLPKIYHISYTGHENSENIMPEIINEMTEWSVILLIITTLLLGFGFGWFGKKYYKNKTNKIKVLEQLPVSLFNPDEKEVINKIKENNNQIKQKELGNQLNWSKSKVSSIITNLEYKKIIRREKLGRNYDIYLEKQIE